MTHAPARPNCRLVRRSPQPRRLALALAAASLMTLATGTTGAQTALSAGTLPTGLSIAAGQAQVAVNGSRMTVTNTPQTILNWQTFSIGANSAVHFQQANAVSSVLNRVTGNDPSAILGSLSSNGRVWLLNPNGVLFGQGARVDVAGLVTSTLRLSDSDFLAGRYSFSAGNPNAEVLNQGELRSSFGGTIALLGDSVRNEGSIQADGGQIILAAGKSIELIDTGAPYLGVRITADAGAARNLGTLQAAGGRIDIHAAAVNSSGIVSADGFATGPGGEIWIKASGTTELAAGSHTSASSLGDKGGSVVLLGQNVGLLGDAQVQADGATGGGSVKVGGGVKGQDPRYPNAEAVFFSAKAGISADATVQGDGGQVVLWSDKSTRAYGSLSTRGGLLGGNGGFIETSGGWLDARPVKIDTSASKGRSGEWLLDPWDIVISDSSSDFSFDITGTNPVSYTPNSCGAQINTTTITNALNAGTSVTITTGTTGTEPGNIRFFDANITPSSASAGNLTVEAAGGIRFTNSNIIYPAGATSQVLLNAAGGPIEFFSNSSIQLPGGSILVGGPTALNSPLGGSAGVGGSVGSAESDGVYVGGGSRLIAGGDIWLSGLAQGFASGVRVDGGVVQAASVRINGESNTGFGVFITGESARVEASDTLLISGLGGNSGVRIGSGATINYTAALTGTGTIQGRSSGFSSGVSMSSSTINHTGSRPLLIQGIAGSPDEGGTPAAVDLYFDAFIQSQGPLEIRALDGGYIWLDGLNLSVGPGGGKIEADSLVVSNSTLQSTNGTLRIYADVQDWSDSSLLVSGGETHITGVNGAPLTDFTNIGNSLTLSTSNGGRWLIFANDLKQSFDPDPPPSARFSPGNLPYDFKRYGAADLSAASGDVGNGYVFHTTQTATLTAALLERPYNGTTTAPFFESQLTTSVSGDTGFFASGSGAVYADANAGNNKPATLVAGPGGSVFGFRDAADKPVYGYTVNVAPGSLQGNITKAPLTFSAARLSNRDYDGTTNVPDFQIDGLLGFVGSETVNFTASAVYLDKNAGLEKPMNVSVLLSDGSNGGRAANYEYTNPPLTGTVFPKPITVAGLSAPSKVYDANTNAVVNGTPSVVPLAGDNLSVLGNLSGTFDSKNVGSSRIVTVNGLLLSGTDQNNYTLGTVTLPSAITPLTLTINGLVAQDKVYDRTTAATIVTSNGTSTNALPGDVVTVGGAITGTFASIHVGTHAVTLDTASVTLGGADAGNYLLNPSQSALSAQITPRPLSVSGLYVENKVYDGTTSAAVQGLPLLSRPVAGDKLNIVGAPTASFQVSDVGSYIVSISGLTLGGANASDYSLTAVSEIAANITPRPFYLVGSPLVQNKVYDGNTSASVSANLTPNIVGSDNVSVSGTLAWSFDSKNVGIRTVAPSGLTLSGPAKDNYTLNLPGLSGEITPRPLSVTGVTVQPKVYDGTTFATIQFNAVPGPELVPGDNVVLEQGLYAGNFATKNVGTAIPVTTSATPLLGADAGNYVLKPLGMTGDITQRPLTWTGLSVNTKVYDSTTAATLAGSASVTALGSDTVSVTGTPSTSFPSKNAGFYPGLLVSGLTLEGADAGNYALVGPSGGLAGQIQQRPLTVSGLTVPPKVYDGNTQAPGVVGVPVITALPGDTVTLGAFEGQGQGQASVFFLDKNVGTNKPLMVFGLGLQGPDASNYTLGPLSITSSITPRPLSLSGLGASNKVYDGKVNATLTGSAILSNGVLEGDGITLTGSATGQFVNKNVGVGKAVLVTGYSLSGTDAGNYSLILPALSANITSLNVQLTGVSAVDKVYDATAFAALTGNPLVSTIPGDAVSLGGTATGVFADKNVGTGKTVQPTGYSLNGADAGNYTLSAAPLSANITPAPAFLSNLAVATKIYDGSASATLNGAPIFVPLGTDLVSVAGQSSASFDNKNAGTGKLVQINGLSLVGADAANYSLPSTITALGSITPRTVQLSGLLASDKTYDSTVRATLAGGASVAAVPGDSLSLLGTPSANFADKNAGNNKPVLVTGYSLGGSDAGNYRLEVPTLMASIIPLAINLTGLVAVEKVYDATVGATLSGTPALSTLAGDTVALGGSATAVFTDKNVGNSKIVQITGLSLSGPDAANYTLPERISTTGNITPLTVRPSGLLASDRTYDGGVRATLTGNGSITPLAGDTLSLLGTPSASFADKNVGSGKAVQVTGYSLAGADAGNYRLEAPLLTAGISALTLNLGGLSAQDKIYDATSIATLTGTPSAQGLPGDSLQLVGAISGTFNSKNVGTAVPISLGGVTLGGADAGNYRLNMPALSASISPLAINVIGLSAQDKVYDASTSARLLGTPGVQALAGDNLAFTGNASGAFAGKNVGSNLPVSVSGLALGGADAGNYLLNPVLGLTASITPRDLVVQGLRANDKVYDTQSGATLAGAATITGLAGDVLGLVGNPLASFNNANAGTAKPVTVSGYGLVGADATNYRLQQPQGLTATISRAPLLYVANPLERIVGEPLGLLSGSVTGFVGSDTLASATTGLPIFTVFVPEVPAVGRYAISGGGLSAVNYSFAQAPANASALNILPVPVTSSTPQVASVTSVVVGSVLGTAASGRSAADAIMASLASSLQRRAEAGVVDVFASPAWMLAGGLAGGSAPSFGAVNLSSMSSSELNAMLAARSSYTQALFADASAQLERDPTLADLKACETMDEANAGRCRVTAEFKTRMQRAMATQTAATAAPAPSASPAPVVPAVATLTPALPVPSAAAGTTAAPTAASTAAVVTAAVRPLPSTRQVSLQSSQRKVKTAALPQIERKIALVLGVGSYQDSTIPELANATRDSDAVAKMLETQLGYEAVVLNNASKAEVVAAMNRIALTAGPRDSVVVYYAGHGELVATTQQGYWLLADSVAQKPETWLSNADINRLVAQIGASQVALISDSCYSGTLASEERLRATPTALDPQVVLGRKSVVVMSSGGNQPVADEGRDGHSPFAWHLMDTLNKVNQWQPGGNIFERVRFAVARALPQRPQYSASRSAGHQLGGEYLFEQRRLDGLQP